MSKLKKFVIILLAIPVLAGLVYASWNVRENYKTGDWSESCGTLFTNPHYRECKQRRAWIPRDLAPWRVVSQTPAIIDIHGGETLRIVSVSTGISAAPNPHGFDMSTTIPLLYLGHNQKFVLVCGVAPGLPGGFNFGFKPTSQDGTVSCP